METSVSVQVSCKKLPGIAEVLIGTTGDFAVFLTLLFRVLTEVVEM